MTSKQKEERGKDRKSLFAFPFLLDVSNYVSISLTSPNDENLSTHCFFSLFSCQDKSPEAPVKALDIGLEQLLPGVVILTGRSPLQGFCRFQRLSDWGLVCCCRRRSRPSWRTGDWVPSTHRRAAGDGTDLDSSRTEVSVSCAEVTYWMAWRGVCVWGSGWMIVGVGLRVRTWVSLLWLTQEMCLKMCCREWSTPFVSCT